MNGVAGTIRTLLCAVLLFVLLPQAVSDAYEASSPSSADQQQQQALDQAAAALYKHAKEGNIVQVRHRLAEVTQLFGSGGVQKSMSVEGIHAFSGAILDVQEAVNAAGISPDAVIQAAASLRLAADVLAHPRQPLWQQYYKIINEDLKEAESQFARGSTSGFVEAVERLEEHYNTIRPAAMISRPPSAVNRTDSWLSYVKGAGVNPHSDPAAVKAALNSGRETLNGLFGRERDAAAFGPFMQTADEEAVKWLIGCLILAALVYAGFRKYRAEHGFFPPTR
ncbi:sporulation protein YpjB [Paenibacillus sp. P96]|uniref:Sporulation protein YpjB n=1 Tax=Paenibacillus zeirhizosphaerae TaxID=2987519 RepID=A0ABT9FQB7_9BACL|nr:sporulation protein YpjB [Paenibacillus sp. P96]MDP4096627.1 sporulation protein YpjB [Paenibacillus sp. P96]